MKPQVKHGIAWAIYIFASLALPYLVLMQFIHANDELQFVVCVIVAMIAELLYPMLKVWQTFYANNNQVVLNQMKSKTSLSAVFKHFAPFLGFLLLSAVIMAFAYAYHYNLIIMGVGFAIFYFNGDYFDKLFKSFVDERLFSLRVLAQGALDSLNKAQRESET